MTPKQQIEGLMNELVPFAEKMLAEHRGFHPFGGYLDRSGKVVHVGVKPTSGNATASDRVEMLVGDFRKKVARGLVMACAIVTDVAFPLEDGSTGDAIKLFLEHREGYCAEVFVRYEIIGDVVEAKNTVAQQGDPMFFVDSSSPRVTS